MPSTKLPLAMPCRATLGWVQSAAARKEEVSAKITKVVLIIERNMVLNRWFASQTE